MLVANLAPAVKVTTQIKQCPTASVQRVAVVTQTKCGCKIVTYREVRAGDKDFQRCRCAEKQSAEKIVLIESQSQKFVGIPLEPPAKLKLRAVAVTGKVELADAAFETLETTPLTQPPQA